jgi:aminoglycoside phosphotransferase (APT) family kinase protein
VPAVTLSGDLGANGVSSETIPIHVDWPASSGHPPADHADYVVRVAPAAADVPVFRSYRLGDQFEVMRLVGELTDVPVPAVRWLEPSGSVLGQPCFVMDAVSGRVPPDVLPYNFGGNWLFDADPADQRRLQDASVSVLARLHEIPAASEKFSFLLPRSSRDASAVTPLRRHLAWTRDWYEFAAGELSRSTLVERSLDWLEQNCPDPAEDPVLCWGDARIGNIMFRDFAPAGVLDWEMAALGPRQLDVAWMIFSHMVFENLTATLGVTPGMPRFLREEDVVATYEGLTGRRVGDLTWYYLYAAVQWSLVFMRTGAAQVRFGEIEMPDEVEGLFHHRTLVEEIARAVGALP